MADIARLTNVNVSSSHRMPPSQAISPVGQDDPFDMKSTLASLPPLPKRSEPAGTVLSAIRIRKLPHNYDHAQLRALLTFADKLESVDFLATSPGDQGFKTAIARFYTASAAQQAQSILDGKQIDPEKTRLVIEITRLSPGSIGSERHNLDTTSSRAHSGSSSGSASRFNGQYQSMNRISPPINNDFAHSGSTSDNYFTSVQGDNRQRVSGRDVIGQDGPDDETSDLLRDPVGYATNGINGLSRRNTSNSQSTSRYNKLALNTSNPTSPPVSGYASPRNNSLQSPASTISPNGMSNLPTPSYQMRHQHYPRPHMPPVNPADQNPPCNTLYVGNLPIDTSEDELKTMFSKQRGYKRLCFRTKQNGPMCFVEFEDVSFATKALNDLYGYPLHNSAHRGGIRLSFSKNPLGVRNGQPGGIGPSTPLSPPGHFPSMNGLGMQSFSTANGPPPGIPAPPGLPMTSNGNTNAMVSPANNMGFSVGGPGSAISPTSIGFGVGDLNAAMGSATPYGMNNGWPRAENYGGYTTGR